MAETELDILHNAEQQEEVVSLYARGVSLANIQKQTGLARKVIDNHLANFREWAKNDKYMISRSREVVLTVDQHYSDIISQYYSAIEEAEMAGDYKQRMTGLSGVAKIESDRVAFLAKAGLVAENAMGDLLAESDRKQSILVDILKDISKKHPEVAKEISSRLSSVTGESEPIRVIDVD